MPAWWLQAGFFLPLGGKKAKFQQLASAHDERFSIFSALGGRLSPPESASGGFAVSTPANSSSGY
jgi:hypothetical protein